MSESPRLTHADLLLLKRFNTPAVCNGWEQITRHDFARDGFNLDETHDFMPELGPMVGYAVTVVIQPSDKSPKTANPKAWSEYRRYVAGVPGPKIALVQDLDQPGCVGAFWGEVNSNTHRALGCVGTITDGSIRDLDEMRNAGFKALARRLSPSHAHSWPVRWGCAVEVFGRRVEPGQLLHADKHGFLAVPREDEARLLDAVRFMDENECQTVIPAARDCAGRPLPELLDRMDDAGRRFREAAQRKFQRGGEW